ncbi:MAG TPA: S8 family serine peptidase, partial [Actinomycetota bacterium]|nr:S8 family serine peptidase [Actinomycetota bacterium]
EASDGTSTAEVADEVTSRFDDNETSADQLTGRFQSVTAVAAKLTGEQILDLAEDGDVQAITRDVPMVAAQNLGGKELGSLVSWLDATKLDDARRRTRAQLPTIAIVDSGIEAVHRDFGNRVVAQVSLTRLQPYATGDGRGHGTFVAGLAAGRYGGAPGARIVSLDVMDDHGKAMTSDVIAAADWILHNKGRFGIRVANFSLHSSRPSSFRTDPLDRAVERLWFSGVVVVTSVGNYAKDGAASGVPFAPANDPFVVTVGAADLGATRKAKDDSNAPWSAHGRTPDGFQKPDLGAPGRRLVGPVPTASTLLAERPDRGVLRGYMRLSGTSLAAPMVSAAAAYVLASHPEWTPDQVKGALMISASRPGKAVAGSLGVGLVDARAAQRVLRPPNPNRGLNRFLITDPSGGSYPVFDTASWDSAAKSDASWDSVSWTDASWADVAWSDASWADASWSDASWSDASWADASWVDASWVD